VCGDEDARLLPVRGAGKEPDPCLTESSLSGEARPSPDVPPLMAPDRVIGQNPGTPYRFIFYHLDHLGSPRVILDVTGNPVTVGGAVSKHNYLPFGEERPVQTDPTINTRAFTGHERDKESGLDYMMARYYSSSLGRFMAVEPGDDTQVDNPQSWNKYSYVRNNPLSNVDPDGRESVAANRTNPDERALARQHPIAAYVGAGLAERATTETAKKFGVLELKDDSAQNAVRHATWGCMMAQSSFIGPELADEFGVAHEVGDANNTPAQGQMDDFNNTVGISLASDPNTSSCVDAAMGALSQGRLQTAPGQRPAATPGATQGAAAGGAQAGGKKQPVSKVDQKVQALKDRAKQGPVKRQ